MGGDPLVPFDARKPSVARVIKAYRAASVHLHSREQVAGCFAGLEIAEPGRS